MNIKEAEELTGVSRQNIRFYEKKGLLKPNRNKDNSYRIYDQEDVYKVKEIVLYRKLGLTIEDIMKIQKGEITVDYAMEHYANMAALHINSLKQQIVVYQEINAELQQGKAFDVEKYLYKIEELEQRGITFFDVVSDYAKKAKDNIYKFSRPRAAMWFEPKEPILKSSEFVDELVAFAKEENKELEFLHVGMEPIIKLDGKSYLAMLEQPHVINMPSKLYLLQGFFVGTRYTYGFKFVYLYSWDEEKQSW